MILSIETATPVCSVALHQTGVIRGSSHLFVEQEASSKLAVMIDELLERCQGRQNELSAIAVSAGPGSYTGLRIGVATAKGMCYALNLPLIAINTLEILVKQMLKYGPGNALLCPMLDARRMEVYCLMATAKGQVVMPTAALIVDQESFAPWLAKDKVIFFGSGAWKCREVIQSDKAIFVAAVHPSAEELGELAFEKFKGNQVESVFDFEPFYLKDFLIKKPMPAQEGFI